MKAIEQAIAELDREIIALPNPQEGAASWFRLRALVAGRSMLRAMLQKGVDGDLAMAESYYRGCRRQFVGYEEQVG